MTWQIPLVILLVSQTSFVILMKIASDKIKDKAVGIFYPLLISALLSFVYAFLTERINMSPAFCLIGITGVAHTAGLYFLWKAFSFSLSKSLLFTPLEETLAIILAVIFLKEGKLWNLQLISGVGFCFSAIYLFLTSVKRKEEEILTQKWLFCIMFATLIFGINEFLVKLFSFSISRQTFLVAKSNGALFGCISILLLKKQNPFYLPKKIVALGSLIGALTIIALFAIYYAYELGGPVSRIVPIRGLCVTVIPIFFGWLVFKERKGLSKKEWLGFLLGIIGAILILWR